MVSALIILLFSLGTLQAENTCTLRNIESITYHSQQGSVIALITLSDDSVWKWSPDFYSENLLRKWSEGDPVLICASHSSGFTLQNPEKPLFNPNVALTFNSYLLFPSIEAVENEIIILSDKSQWQVIYDFNKRTLDHWATGDRIIPVQGINKNFELINIDIPYDNRYKVERFIDVIPSLLEDSLEAAILSEEELHQSP